MRRERGTSKLLTIGLLIAAVAASGAAPAAAARGQKEKGAKGALYGLYDARYCEIFAVHQPEPPGFSIDVFNTIGLSDCPEEQWEAVDYGQVKQEQGAVLAVPNGPRRWVIDSITGAKASSPLTIGGMEMRKVAVLELPTLQPPPYTEMRIARTTEWNYRKGRWLRFLVSPSGGKYALQAYTWTVDPSLTERRLNRLGSNPAMALPDGWSFRTRRLQRKLTLPARGMATIMRDTLGGTYQKFDWPKRKPRR